MTSTTATATATTVVTSAANVAPASGAVLRASEALRLTCPLSAWTGGHGRCQWCNTLLPAGGRRTVWCRDACRRVFERNHEWRRARAYARRRAHYRCSRPGCEAERGDIEINHLTPRAGAGYGPGCHHHQDPTLDPESGKMTGGLEALCHAHHVEVTNTQRAQRAQRAARSAAAVLAEVVPRDQSR